MNDAHFQLARRVYRQLADPTVREWISDGSTSKTASGRLVSLERGIQGKAGKPVLRIGLDSGKTVTWRLPVEVIDWIIDQVSDICALAASEPEVDVVPREYAGFGCLEFADHRTVEFYTSPRWKRRYGTRARRFLRNAIREILDGQTAGIPVTITGCAMFGGVQ